MREVLGKLNKGGIRMNHRVKGIGFFSLCALMLASCGPEPTAPTPLAPGATAPEATPMVPVPSPANTGGLRGRQGLGLGTPSFLETFSDPQLDARKWNALSGFGSITLGNGQVKLGAPKSTTFPFLATKLAAIPTDGPWAIEWRFTWTAWSDLVNFGLDFFPPTAYGSNRVFPPFFLASPKNDYLAAALVQGDKRFNVAPVFDNKAHTFRFEGGDDNVLKVFFDEKLLHQSTYEVRPLRFWLGAYPLNPSQAPRAWAEVYLDYVVAGPLLQSIADIPDPNASGTPQVSDKAASSVP